MKKLLIIVDYQNDFVTGSLGFAKAKAIEKPIANEIKKYFKNKDTVIFLKDTHDKNYLKTIEGKNLPIVHTVKNTKGWELYGEVGKLSNGKKVFNKNTFGSTKLFEYLSKNKFSEIQLCGLLTNMCVLVNACICKSVCPNTPIIINKRCVTSNDVSLENAAIKILKNLHIKII